jgi:hypothetical protein
VGCAGQHIRGTEANSHRLAAIISLLPGVTRPQLLVCEQECWLCACLVVIQQGYCAIHSAIAALLTCHMLVAPSLPLPLPLACSCGGILLTLLCSLLLARCTC